MQMNEMCKKNPEYNLCFHDDKKVSNLRSYNIIECWSGEVICVINIIILNSTAIFGAFARERHLIEVCRWQVNHFYIIFVTS